MLINVNFLNFCYFNRFLDFMYRYIIKIWFYLFIKYIIIFTSIPALWCSFTKSAFFLLFTQTSCHVWKISLVYPIARLDMTHGISLQSHAAFSFPLLCLSSSSFLAVLFNLNHHFLTDEEKSSRKYTWKSQVCLKTVSLFGSDVWSLPRYIF